MGVEKTYYCNLCGDRFANRDAASKQLVCIQFCGNTLHAADLHSTENHVCLDCIKGIVTIANTNLKGRI